MDVIKRRCTEGAGDEEERCKTGEGAEIRGKASFNDLRAIKLASSDLWNISVQGEYLTDCGFQEESFRGVKEVEKYSCCQYY